MYNFYFHILKLTSIFKKISFNFIFLNKYERQFLKILKRKT